MGGGHIYSEEEFIMYKYDPYEQLELDLDLPQVQVITPPPAPQVALTDLVLGGSLGPLPEPKSLPPIKWD